MTPDASERRYGRRLALSLLAYSLLVPISILILERVEGTLLRMVVALLPLLPTAFGLSAFLRYLRSLDEFQQRIQLEAMGFSLGATSLTTFMLAFLENAGGPQVGMIWVFPMIIAFWGIGRALAGRRYQ